jgi:5S rRNA maturation endonuclease (ribonuclease M5)
MISTKHLVINLETVPKEWIFENYCNLSQKLCGQNVKLKSLFNPSERTPSMYVFYCNIKNTYKYKDFSTDKSGDAIDLVQSIFSLSNRYEAVKKIVSDYNDFILHNKDYSIADFKKHSRYEVSLFETRDWNNLDAKYWGEYSIGSQLLKHYHVKPLKLYEMSKEEDGETKTLSIKGHFIYGYFKRDGSLYKIYQPKIQTKKFLKVKNYIQGSEQLSKSDTLFIASSLKDGMCLKNMFKKYDFIAPDSENTLIKKEQLDTIVSKYSRVYVIFDNDDAGRNATEKYISKYDKFIPIYLDMEKDVADAVKVHGYNNVYNRIKQLV